MDFSIQDESGDTRHSPSEVLCNGKAINRLGSALDLRGLSLIFSSVENIPGVKARSAFTVDSAAVFREDCDIMPSTFGNIKYMPWGADNQMPYDIIDLCTLCGHNSGCFAKNAINGNRMRDIVNFIRYRLVTFRLWHTSATAKLFSPPPQV